jgi:S1-C subfamily serine protease
MPQSPRTAFFLSALLGGLMVLVVGAILIATDVIETGESTREVVRPAAVARPAAEGAEQNGGLTVSEIYDRDGPGVVFVEARIRRRVESPFGFPQPEQGLASGSGFVLDKDGYILTNAHVVEGAREVTVRFGEREEVEAKVEGTDLSTDVAVLKVDTDRDRLKPLELGDSSKVEVGDLAIAIGNPFGFDRTVTTGIISALQRQIEAPNQFPISNVIQTDASINPGNSGGPLLDGTGKVIGINSQIATPGQGSVGIGFAVPIDTAKRVVPQLKEKGKVERAYLGISTITVTDRIADDLNLPRKEGALVQDVVEDGPADKAGLRGGRTTVRRRLAAGGDLLVRVDGDEITRSEDIAAAIADNQPGDEVTVEYYRGDDRKSARVKLGTRPERLERPSAEERPQRPEDLFPLP